MPERRLLDEETLQDSVRDGPDSAYKSIIDASQTLLTDEARSCGANLVAHSEAFIAGLDFTEVTDIPGLKKAADAYLRDRPLPACLPAVPPWDGGSRP